MKKNSHPFAYKFKIYLINVEISPKHFLVLLNMTPFLKRIINKNETAIKFNSKRTGGKVMLNYVENMRHVTR